MTDGRIQLADPPANGAVISPCRYYRYVLTRTWDPSLPVMVWCMLNPSIADATANDPTVRKCIGFATRLGYGGILIVNLFGFRATEPRDLVKLAYELGGDPDGPDNELWWQLALGIGAREIHVGWGSAKNAHQQALMNPRIAKFCQLARALDARLFTIGTNAPSPASGPRVPKHPLMTAYDTPRTPWSLTA